MKLALIGFGNIGTGVEELIYKNRYNIKKSTGIDISIKTVLVNNIAKKREFFDKGITFTNDFEDILRDDEIDTVVEVTATEKEAYFYISKLFKAGKNVVTANKAVVSKYFEELKELSLKEDVHFLFEASVGGGVHIIKSILEDLPFNKINKVNGILNGTCNYILTEMTKNNLDFNEALLKAQELGYAEPDPTADINGKDTVRKIRILSTLIFNAKVNEDNIYSFGIDKIDSKDIKFLSDNSFTLKLIGEAKYIENKYFAYVIPVAVKGSSKFYNIENSNNIVSYNGTFIGDVSFIGAGAGKYPTSDSILRDILDIANGNVVFNRLDTNEELSLSNYDLLSKFYLRIPKEYTKLINTIKDETFEDDDNVYILTKIIKLSEILEIISKISDGNYFFAKIEEEV